MKCISKLFDILPFVFSIIGAIYGLASKNPWFIIPADASFHFSLITVNALFGGFLYTNYSLLIGLLDKSVIEKIKNTNIIKRRNQHILRGIIYATVSVIAGLYMVLVSPSSSCISKLFYSLILNIEIVFMAFLIIYFLLSLYEMSLLVKSVHSSQNAKTDEEIKSIKRQIKEAATKKN